MRLLVVGGSGHVGRHVVRAAEEAGWSVEALSRTSSPPLDATDPHALAEALVRVGPDAVVNAVPDRAASLALARGVATAGVRLVHVSTDCVLRGRDEPYPESAPPDPVDWDYARDKAAVEHALADLAHQAHVAGVAVVRPSVVLGPGSHHEHVDQAYFTDVVRQPVHVEDLAALVVALAGGTGTGVFHAAGPQEVTRHQLARGLARRAGGDPDRVRSTTLASLGIDRPAVLRLDTSRAARLATLRPVGDYVPL